MIGLSFAIFPGLRPQYLLSVSNLKTGSMEGDVSPTVKFMSILQISLFEKGGKIGEMLDIVYGV